MVKESQITNCNENKIKEEYFADVNTMPPKSKGKKKKKGKGSKSGDAKTKTKDVEILTFNEAVLIYQLQAKQKQHEDLVADIEDLQRRVKRQKDRNKSLKNEKQKYLNEAIRKAKEHETQMQKRAEVPFEEVETALKEKLEAGKKGDDQIHELKTQISRLVAEIKQVSSEISKFEEFRHRVRFENEKHIKLLRKEVVDMDESYEELSEFFARNLENIKHQIERSTKENIDNEKKLASEQALEALDTSSHQEFSDNKWLLQEIQIHKEHLKDLFMIVEDLEKQNVEMMSDLLATQFEDVRISRDFFTACNDGTDEDDGEDDDNASHNGKISTEKQLVPHSEDDNENEDSKWLDNYFASFGDDTQEITKLSTHDMQMLCIVGKKKVIHHEVSKKDEERLNAIHQNDEDKRHLVWMSNNFT